MICNRCGQEIRPKEKTTVTHWTDTDDEILHRNCLKSAIARAKAAEGESARLTERITELEADRTRWIDALRETNDALKEYIKIAQHLYTQLHATPEPSDSSG